MRPCFRSPALSEKPLPHWVQGKGRSSGCERSCRRSNVSVEKVSLHSRHTNCGGFSSTSSPPASPVPSKGPGASPTPASLPAPLSTTTRKIRNNSKDEEQPGQKIWCPTLFSTPSKPEITSLNLSFCICKIITMPTL